MLLYQCFIISRYNRWGLVLFLTKNQSLRWRLWHALDSRYDKLLTKSWSHDDDKKNKNLGPIFRVGRPSDSLRAKTPLIRLDPRRVAN